MHITASVARLLIHLTDKNMPSRR